MSADAVADGVLRILSEGDRPPGGSALNIELRGHICNVIGARGHPACVVIVVATSFREAGRLEEAGWAHWGSGPGGPVFAYQCSATRPDTLARYVSAVVVGFVIQELWGLPENSTPRVTFTKHAEVTVG